jgi:hypothetical protein
LLWTGSYQTERSKGTIAELIKTEIMLLDKLEKLEYRFEDLPEEIQQSIDFMTEMRSKTQGTSDQKISVLDLALFNTIEVLDPKSELVQTVRQEYDLDQKTDSNNSFNTKGVVDLSGDEMRIVEQNDDLMNLSDTQS